MKEVRKFAKQQMGTDDVRLDIRLNKFIWSQGVRLVVWEREFLCGRGRLVRNMPRDRERRSTVRFPSRVLRTKTKTAQTDRHRLIG